MSFTSISEPEYELTHLSLDAVIGPDDEDDTEEPTSTSTTAGEPSSTSETEPIVTINAAPSLSMSYAGIFAMVLGLALV